MKSTYNETEWRNSFINNKISIVIVIDVNQLENYRAIIVYQYEMFQHNFNSKLNYRSKHSSFGLLIINGL